MKFGYGILTQTSKIPKLHLRDDCFNSTEDGALKRSMKQYSSSRHGNRALEAQAPVYEPVVTRF